MLRVDTPIERNWVFLHKALVCVSRKIFRRLKILDCSRLVPTYRFGFDIQAHFLSLMHEEAFSALVVCQHATFIGLRNLPTGVATMLLSHGDVFSHPLNAFPFGLRQLYAWGARKSYRSADAIVAVSRFLARQAVKFRGSDRGVHVVPNGLDMEDASCMPQRVSHPKVHGSKFKLLYVGRLAPEKGIHVLLESLAHLPRDSFELTIVGAGQEMDKLLALSRSRGLEQFVRFVGSVRKEEVWGYYRDADLLVVPSISEGQGVVIIEAMAIGVPVIASRVGGIPELVEHGTNGFLFTAGDSVGLARLIEYCARDYRLLRRISDKARESSRAFGWNAVLPNIRQILVDSISVAQSQGVRR